uniref:Sperm flagellar 2 n=1 Tax=Cyprinus carpio carpio TaxID=630221 RepID=A0A9J7YVX3_CYPCA
MSDIICQWLNVELRLSKVTEPYSFTRDFANGYLIGEILHRYELQDDFHLFSKQSTANAKLNNFTRIEPTLQLLGVPFDLAMAKAVMQGRQGAATHLLYQLYIQLQKKKKSGLTATAMEVMQPAATARLKESHFRLFVSQRLKTVVKRETDLKMQKIAKHFHKRGQAMYNRSVMAELLKEEDRLKRQEERRLRDIEKHRQARRKQHEIMIQIQSAIVQIPKPPHARTSRASEKQLQFRKKQEVEPISTVDKEQWNKEYIESIRQRLEEDSAAREQREMRRRRALMEQLQAHEAQQELLREEQMVSRLMRQTQQEKRITVQLMQIKQQKEVLRQNRIFQERQYQERRLRDFQEALDREAVLAQQERLERSEEIRMERELHKQLVAERAQARYRKHFEICRGILEQIVDLATKAGEYRLLTANLIPVKLMQEWMELFFNGKPLYEVASVDPAPADPTPEQIIELEKLQILNNQDYNEYVAMKGEWVWHEEGESQAPPVNDILDHVLSRLQSLIVPLSVSTPRPLFPRFTIRACMLGKSYSGKTTCLAKITYQQDKQAASESQKESQWSLRAQRGAAVEQALRTGKAVPDQLLVDIIVDAIRNIPADSGWILDGFPVDITQAQMLEKALNRTESDQAETKTHSNSATDKNSPKDPPPPSPALDLVVLLDISDEQVLERARDGRDAPDEKMSMTDVDTHDPASSSDEKSLGRKQIQHRISGFHDTWPKLEKWFGDQQNILVKVTADVDEDTLSSNVKIVLMDTMDSVEKGAALGDSRKMSTSSSAEHTRPESACSAKSKSATPKSAGRRYVEEPLPKEIPVYLVPYWENVCNSYVTNVKTVMQNLRSERKLIIHHLYNIRENFRQYLQKTDLKQEFVSVWQGDYNSVPDNIREDEETKGELHQRLDDLRERLWDICDKRKEEAEQERAGVIDDGWLDDHTAVLINHYSALMQIEVGRFQDSLCLLRDYYTAMCKTAFPESTRGFTRVPLIDITCVVLGAPTPQQEPSPQPVVEKNPEEVKRKAERKRIKQEFTAALKREEHAVKLRLELIKAHALRTVSSLQQKAEQAYRNMEEWLGTRFLSEMNSIDQLTELVRQHIENGVQIHHELVLQSADFCVDGDTLVVASPSPAPRRSPLEQSRNSTLTVQQLHILCAQLRKTAPAGLMCSNELTEVLHELTSPHMGSDVLPEPWMHITPSQFDELVCVLAPDSEMLDWRQFLLSAALPWPFPSQTQLLKTLQRYRAVDTAGTGLITQEQYAQIELWFPSERDLPVPDDPTEPLPYDRLANLKKFFFSLFASTHSSPLMLDYLSMLLYFCCHPEPAQGFTRALSLVIGHTLSICEIFVSSRCSLEIFHLVVEYSDNLCFCRSVDGVKGLFGAAFNVLLCVQELLKVFKELGFKGEEKIPFSTLSQHPFLQDLMEASSQYLLPVSVTNKYVISHNRAQW